MISLAHLRITADGFPHIIDSIFEYAQIGSLLALRGACKAWNERATKSITHHMILEEDGIVTLRSGQARGSILFPAAKFMRCFTGDFPFIKHAKVLDLSGVLTRPASGLLHASPQRVDTLRILSSCTDAPEIPIQVRRIVYIDPRDTIPPRHSTERMVVHLRRPAKNIHRDLFQGIRSTSELIVVLHPWEFEEVVAPAPRNAHQVHEYIQTAL